MSTSRRQFIQQTALLSTAFLMNTEDFFKKNKNIGLQLYTLRNEMQKDPKGTLQKVAALGYKEVETFGYNEGKWFGLNAPEFSATLSQNGLTSPSGHTFPGSMFLKDGWEDKWKKGVDDSKAIGQDYIVIPWVEEPYRKPIDNFKKIAEGLNKAAVIAKSAGSTVAYHNHDFEFLDQGGQTGFEILMKETDVSMVKLELDLYWAVKAGHDPVDLINSHPGRFAMWHIKDMDNTDKKFFTEVGNGTIDFKPIFAKAKKSGMKHFYVEQDICPGSPLDSIAKSIDFMKKNIVK